MFVYDRPNGDEVPTLPGVRGKSGDSGSYQGATNVAHDGRVLTTSKG